ncbi:alpha/beta fold hydrolase [Nocardia blacklockiae]|uniref:alpha/beta fold hydrolase n=1 Tax=Nocardia blacklockiae TaxID=480036 RepID=UPI001893DAAA|nr:alpha/beta hydrolase [Nocardia blacklockiae]MBF6175791.1 alpha/beta hydrolase [Nocardia blacklockiae]
MAPTVPAAPERIRVSGGEVSYYRIGSGPPVVLTHGTPSRSLLWRHIAPVLAVRHTVYVWDLLGYGDSTLSPELRPSVARHAATLAELAERWELDDPVLVGHDIGAATVLRAHLRHDVPVRALALLDAAVLPPWTTPVAQHIQAHLDAYRSMPEHIFHELVRAHLATATHRPLDPVIERAYLAPYAGPAGQQRYLDQVEGFDDADTRDLVADLPEISAPALVLWGQHDRWLPAATASRLAAALPHAAHVTVPEAGHFLPEDDPTATVTELSAFLHRVVPR